MLVVSESIFVLLQKFDCSCCNFFFLQIGKLTMKLPTCISSIVVCVTPQLVATCAPNLAAPLFCLLEGLLASIHLSRRAQVSQTSKQSFSVDWLTCFPPLIITFLLLSSLLIYRSKRALANDSPLSFIQSKLRLART